MISNLKQNVNDLLDPQMAQNALQGTTNPPAGQQRLEQKSAEFSTQFKQTWNSLQEKPWNQVLESSVELGSLMVLDLLITHVATHATTVVGQKFITEVATVFKQEGAGKAYCKEIAILGKALVEAEEQKTVTTHQTNTTQPITKRPKLQNLENIIELTKAELGETVFAQRQVEQVKYIETLKVEVFEIGSKAAQYIKPGGYQEALADFYRIGPLDVKPLPGKDGLMGILYDGSHINVRVKSSRNSKPTIEIQYSQFNRTKIRYGAK